MHYELSVIVPCYDEEKNINLIVKRFLELTTKNVELVLVDNGSKDNSLRVMQEFKKKYKFISIVKVKKNIGYGFGIWSGLKVAKSDYLCWTHADMQTDLADTIKAFKIMNRYSDNKYFIKGKRHGRLLFDNFFTLGMSVFETLFLGKCLYDINAQPNLFHRSFLDEIDEPPKDFSFDLYFYYVALRKNYIVKRFSVNFSERIHGISHWNTGLASKYKFIKRTIDFSLKLKKILK